MLIYPSKESTWYLPNVLQYTIYVQFGQKYMIGQKLNVLLHVHFLRVKIENRDRLTFLKVTVDSSGL